MCASQVGLKNPSGSLPSERWRLLYREEIRLLFRFLDTCKQAVGRIPGVMGSFSPKSLFFIHEKIDPTQGQPHPVRRRGGGGRPQTSATTHDGYFTFVGAGSPLPLSMFSVCRDHKPGCIFVCVLFVRRQTGGTPSCFFFRLSVSRFSSRRVFLDATRLLLSPRFVSLRRDARAPSLSFESFRCTGRDFRHASPFQREERSRRERHVVGLSVRHIGTVRTARPLHHPLNFALVSRGCFCECGGEPAVVATNGPFGACLRRA